MKRCPTGFKYDNGKEECISNEIANFEIKRYLGVWHEQGSTPLWFSRGCTNTTAKYSIEKDGNIKVENRCIVNGSQKKSTGKAYKTDEKGLLKVGFFPSKRPLFKADYKISYIDEGYKTAIVTSGKSVWILTRDKEITKHRYNVLIAKANRLEIDTRNIKRTENGWRKM